MKADVQNLITLYQKTSKHSNYQVLPTQLKNIISEESLQIKSRHEEERLTYILDKVKVADSVFCDIGGNSGFFTFELLNHGAQKGIFYEGNRDHAAFVQAASEILNLQEKIEIHDQYFDFQNDIADSLKKHIDVTILFNVLHHVGDDYGHINNIESARENIINELKKMAQMTSLLVFQLGFNWMGDRNRCLFREGTKKEMIDWLKDNLRNEWEILHIGIAENHENTIVYRDVNSSNIERNDSLGEFLNRPIFILKSKLL
ncbi:MAG: class I SAM-dependent methyltransferase [Lachnospiraceae bacterium]|nr:class I SAM-dependent methyltransferase [Lachnospiraceae bacterium]